METLFDTRDIPRNQRFAAWKDALCGNYVTVDATLDEPDGYFGYIRYADLGGIQLSETHGAKQSIRRKREHLAHLDKDCFYLQIMPQGAIGLRQRGQEILTHAGKMAFYYASEPYELDCVDVTKGRFLEIPRDALEARLAEGDAGGRDMPLVRGLNTTHGIGKVLQDMCATLVDQVAYMNADQKAALGADLVGMTALALTAQTAGGEDEAPNRRATRLAAIQHVIRENATNPNLSAARIARDQGISLRYLHRLFQDSDTSATDFLWQCRLDLAWARLTGPVAPDTITDVAYACGFSSSSHFSQMFRRHFGLTPSQAMNEARRGGRLS